MACVAIFHRLRTLIGFGALALCVFAGALTAHTASAALGTCRTDPIVTLSNGTKVQIVAHIGAGVANVNSIAYTLHAPAGTTVTSVDYLGDVSSRLESLHFYADAPARSYQGTATVTTNTHIIPVYTSMAVTPSSGSSLASSTSGHDGQVLHMSVSF
jgi:hypothetical protein